MPRLTKQQYYDRLVQAAQDGTFPALDAGLRQCVYRNEDGSKKCAVGILIPEELYKPEYDANPMGFRNLPDALKELITPHGMTEADMRDVQLCHDGASGLRGDEVRWFRVFFVARINALPCFNDVVRTWVHPGPASA